MLLSHTGSSFAKTTEGRIQHSSNWEGTATGYGAVFGTLATAFPLGEAGASSGTCTWVAQAYPEDGSVVGGSGEGTWQQASGQHKWALQLNIEVSNGDRIQSEGEIDLATRTYTGKIFAAG